MTGPNPDSFEHALAKFKSNLNPSLQREFATCTINDVHKTIQKLQDKQNRDRNIRALGRLQAFIEAIDQFGKVVQVFLNVHEILCFVWGPIKFLLTITSTYLEIFDKLLDAYARIGEAIPDLLYYKETFQRYLPLATILEDYYSDILNFHSEALVVFAQPKWKKLFRASWKTFEINFGPILQSLARRRQLIESEKGSASLEAIQKLREEIAEVHREQKTQTAIKKREDVRIRMNEIKERLQSSNYEFDHEVSTEDRGSNTSSGQWIFEHPNFRSWHDHSLAHAGVLYVNGMPGAGKTTLMCKVIQQLFGERLLSEGQCFVGYFYFKHEEKDTHNLMLRAILEQLLKQNAPLLDHIFDQIASLEGIKLRTTGILQSLVEMCFENYKTLYIVLDGLDECAKGESEKTVDWYLSLLDSQSSEYSLRVIISGQRDGVLDERLSQKPSIPLESTAHNEDIYNYCAAMCEQITAKFFKSSSSGEEARNIEEEILSLVATKAKGMFLYARVVLENLLAQTRLSRLKKEIQPETFPQGIENAFERVVARIIEHSSSAEREDAIKMLGLVIHAGRLLYWREVQAFFCIDLVNGELDLDNLLQVSCKDLCGSLLDIRHTSKDPAPSEDMVRIVHDSARKYLLRKYTAYFSAEGIGLTTFCCQYLTSEPFEFGLEKDVITSFASQGYYALQDYVVQFWYDHCRIFLLNSNGSDSSEFALMVTEIKNLLNSYNKHDNNDDYQEAVDITTTINTFNKVPQHGRERSKKLNIEFRTSLIRQHIESMQESNTLLSKDLKTFRFFHGPRRFKCSRPWCYLFAHGFETMEELQKHSNRHELPFVCNVDSCLASSIGFDSQSSLDIHVQNWHQVENEPIRFPIIRQKKPLTIWAAAAAGNTQAVSDFLNEEVSVNDRCPKGNHKDKTALYLAAQSGHVETCHLLLDRGADIYAVSLKKGNSWTALHGSVEAGKLDTTRFLLSQKGISEQILRINDKINNPVTIACNSRHEDMVRLLLDSGNCDMGLVTAAAIQNILQHACATGNARFLQYLLGHRALQHGGEKYISHALDNYRGHDSDQIIKSLLATGLPTLSVKLWEAAKSLPNYLTELMLRYPKWEGMDNVVWRGRISMPNVADFNATAKHAGGAKFSPRGMWYKLMPNDLKVTGRLSEQKANEYLCGLRYSPSADIIVVSISPMESAERAGFNAIVDYFISRGRYGVVSEKMGQVRDTYIVPVPAGEDNHPEFMTNLVDNEIPKVRAEPMLLAVFVQFNSQTPKSSQRPSSLQQQQQQQQDTVSGRSDFDPNRTSPIRESAPTAGSDSTLPFNAQAQPGYLDVSPNLNKGDFSLFPPSGAQGDQFSAPLFGEPTMNRSDINNMTSPQTHLSIAGSDPMPALDAQPQPDYLSPKLTGGDFQLFPPSDGQDDQLQWDQDWKNLNFKGHRRTFSEYADVSRSPAISPRILPQQNPGIQLNDHSLSPWDLESSTSPIHSDSTPVPSNPLFSGLLNTDPSPADFSKASSAQNSIMTGIDYGDTSYDYFDPKQWMLDGLDNFNSSSVPPAALVRPPTDLLRPNMEQDSLTPPDRGRLRNRPRAVTDPFNNGPTPNRQSNVNNLPPSFK